MVDVPREQWRAGNANPPIMIFEELGRHPDVARQWRGTVWLTFAEVDAPDGPILQPEIQRYLRTLFEAVPHVLYFLDADPLAGSAGFYLASIGGVEATEDDAVWRAVMTPAAQAQV